MHYFNTVLGILTILLQIACVLLLFLLFLFPKENKFRQFTLSFISNKFLLIGFLISLSSLVFSLFYSEVVGYAACFLCWWQRIALFPQILLFGIAFLKKDRQVINYIFPIIFIGFLISTYHNFIYYFSESGGSCDASGISCVQRLVDELGGYASIPMFSLTIFIALITLLLIAHFYIDERGACERVISFTTSESKSHQKA